MSDHHECDCVMSDHHECDCVMSDHHEGDCALSDHLECDCVMSDHHEGDCALSDHHECDCLLYHSHAIKVQNICKVQNSKIIEMQLEITVSMSYSSRNTVLPKNWETIIFFPRL